MNSRSFFICFLVAIYTTSPGQNVTYNYLVDTANKEIKQVQQLFENYIRSKPDSVYNNPYWNDTDKKHQAHFDILAGEFQPSLYMGFPVHVLSINSENGIFEIKAMFSSCRQDKPPYVLAIMNYIARKENNEYKLHNYLHSSRSRWNKQKIGLVTFYYPLYHQFDTLKAIQMNILSDEVCRNLKIEPVAYEYYFADNFDELQKLKGIDYYMGMGGEVKPTGRGGNFRVFCSGMGENYFHEPFHILLGDNYTCHLWANEGAATYFGGSRGRDLSWHLNKVNDYLKTNKNTDLGNMLTMRTLDEYTDFRYAIGGLVVKLVIDKGGWDLLRQFLNSGKSDHDYYMSIEKCLGVKREHLDKYLREQINKEATKKHAPQ